MQNKINDANWKGWRKMRYIHHGFLDGKSYTIELHYWMNPVTGEISGAKFK